MLAFLHLAYQRSNNKNLVPRFVCTCAFGRGMVSSQGLFDQLSYSSFPPFQKQLCVIGMVICMLVKSKDGYTLILKLAQVDTGLRKFSNRIELSFWFYAHPWQIDRSIPSKWACERTY